MKTLGSLLQILGLVFSVPGFSQNVGSGASLGSDYVQASHQSFVTLPETFKLSSRRAMLIGNNPRENNLPVTFSLSEILTHLREGLFTVDDFFDYTREVPNLTSQLAPNEVQGIKIGSLGTIGGPIEKTLSPLGPECFAEHLNILKAMARTPERQIISLSSTRGDITEMSITGIDLSYFWGIHSREVRCHVNFAVAVEVQRDNLPNQVFNLQIHLPLNKDREMQSYYLQRLTHQIRNQVQVLTARDIVR